MLKARVKLGNCLDVLKRFPDDTVDCIVTDPPYGLTPVSPRGKKTKASGGFMAAKWDVDVPSTKIWRECLRVLKPGAFAFIMCSPRQDCLAKLILRLQKAGFVIGYTSIYWIHSQGFGKAKNIGKHLDKKAGAAREVIGTSSNPNNKPGGYTGKRYKTKRHTRFGVVQDQPDQSLPATDEAKRLDGSYAGYQPKPNLENIVVVMKSITETTYIDQTLANGKGCTWLDDCRIPVNLAAGATQVGRVMNRSKRETDVSGQVCGMNKSGSDRPMVVQPSGRVPSNVLVQDDALRGAGPTKSHGGGKASFGGCFGNGKDVTDKTAMQRFANNAGSVSRYFDLDAWFAERIGDLPESAQATFPFLYVAKPSRREKNTGLEGRPEKTKPLMGEFKTNPGRSTPKSSPTPRANHHPTVKSVKLMHYLVTLGSRPNDLVLDPFCGSGTTGVAAVTLKRNFYGIEQEPEYVEIAKTRIRYARENRPSKTKRPEPKPPTKSLWGPKC